MTDRKSWNSTLRPVAKRKIGQPKKPKPKGAGAIERLLGEGAVFKASSFKSKPRKKMKHRSKGPTGEKVLFIHLFYMRGGKSEVSGTPLVPPPDGDGPEYESQWRAFLSQFSHILPKGTYRKFRLREDNIVLKTIEEHRLWEQEKSSLMFNKKWKWVFDREESLKAEANGVH